MRKSAITLLFAAISAEALDIETEQTDDASLFATPTVNSQEEAPVVESVPYDGYFSYGNHHSEDYSQPSTGLEQLPSADFNKHVYEFDETK